MCLIGFSWKNHPRYALILVGNRDEFYDRKTASAHFWEDAPHILAGKDLEGGGTWLGINKQGQFTALTNYRDLANIKQDAPTRGLLTLDYLQAEIAPTEYAYLLQPHAEKYNGFNILLGDLDHLTYFSNYDPKVRELPSGLYGLSNHLLDTDWYKVRKLKTKLQKALEESEPEPEALLDLMHDLLIPPDEEVQQTGLSLAQEKMLSPMFIKSPNYGTHSSSVLMIDYQHNVRFFERVYESPHREAEEQSFSFTIQKES